MKIAERIIKDVNGLDMYMLTSDSKSGIQDNFVLLLHGFPELSYSFRHLIHGLSKKGIYCIAPDQRGYGQTVFINKKKEQKLKRFSVINLVKDIDILLKKLNIKKVNIVGHDFGAYVASYFTLIHTNKVKSLTIMSMPFAGAPDMKMEKNSLNFINKNLQKLKPKRKHYQVYFSSPSASKNMENSEIGLTKFLRNYFFYKSHNYVFNKPFKIKNYDPKILAQMPEYYIMKNNLGMSETVKDIFPKTKKEKNFFNWMKSSDLKVFTKN